MTWKTKLHPQRFSGMSGMMAAIVGYILGETLTDPAIAAMAITSDGCVLARHEGDIGMNAFIGGASDLERNWSRLLDCADLTEDERKEAEAAYAAKLEDWRK